MPGPGGRRATLGTVCMVLVCLFLSTTSAHAIDDRDDSSRKLDLVKQLKEVTCDGDRVRAQFLFHIRNRSASALLSEIQLTDDLTTMLGGAEFEVIELASRDLSVDPSYNGMSNTDMLTGNDSLGPREARVVTLGIVFRPLTPTDTLLNQASATARDGTAMVSFEAEETIAFECAPLPPEPSIRLTKSVEDVRTTASGFAVDFHLRVENTGNTILNNVSISDELLLTFPDPVVIVSVSEPMVTGALSLGRADFGPGQPEILSRTESLPVGSSAEVSFTVDIGPSTISGAYTNLAVAVGTSPEGTDVSDQSDADVVVPQLSRLGLAKSSDACRPGEDGWVDTTLQFRVENYGNTVLTDLQIGDVLTDAFPDLAFSVAGITSSELSINSEFDGIDDSALLDRGNSLAPGASASASLTLRLDPTAAGRTFLNSATAFAGPPPTVSDVSTNGPLADANGNGNPNDDDEPTPIVCEQGGDPGVNLTKHIDGITLTDDAPRTYRVDFRLEIENTGAVELRRVSLSDAIRDTFPGDVEIRSLTIPEVSGDLSLENSGFSLDDPELLATTETLPIAGTATVVFSVTVTPGEDLGPFDNFATVTGTTPVGTEVSDNADAEIRFPNIRLTKHIDAVEIIDAAVPAYRIDFRLEIVNNGAAALHDVALTDVLRETFPDPVVIDAVSVPVVAGDLSSENESFGADDANLLTNDETLAAAGAATVEFSVDIRPGDSRGPFLNSATVIGTTDDGIEVSATDSIDEELPDRPEQPEIHLTKTTEGISWNRNGYVVDFSLAIENGDTRLDTITLTDDLEATFPAPIVINSVGPVFASGALQETNSAFSATDHDLLSNNETLEPREAAEVTFSVEVAPGDQFGPHINRATVSGTAPDGTVVDDQDSTPVSFPIPDIDLTKEIVNITTSRDDQRVRYRVTVRNTGATTLYDVQITDDLREAFPQASSITVVAGPMASGALSHANPEFSATSIELLDGSESLDIDEVATVEYTVAIAPAEIEGSRENTARTTAYGPGRYLVTDFATTGFPLGGVQGSVYLDRNHNRERDLPGDEPAADWIIQVFDSTGTLVRDPASDDDGHYLITGLQPGDYTLQFVHPETMVAWDRTAFEVVADELARVDHPLDPQGIVYDLGTRTPADGARVYITDSTRADLPDDCLLERQQGQTVRLPRAEYVFVIKHDEPGCPAEGEFGIRVVPPDGFVLSTQFPPKSDPYDATMCSPEVSGVTRPPCLVQMQSGPPMGNDPEDLTHYDRFTTNATANTIVNNHIPIETEQDPRCLGITVAPNRSVVRQSAVIDYTITVFNTEPGAADVEDVRISDQPAQGFEPLLETAILVRTGDEENDDGLFDTPDDVETKIEATFDDTVRFAPFAMRAGETVRIQYMVEVSIAVSPGVHENISLAECEIDDTIRKIPSPPSRVIVQADPLFGKATLLGKVFNDEDLDDVQDDGEKGMENVRLITPEGLEIITDEFGRFHIADIDVTTSYGINYVVKIDTNTLPDGAHVASSLSQIVRLTPGGIGRVKFAVKMPETPPRNPNCCCAPVSPVSATRSTHRSSHPTSCITAVRRRSRSGCRSSQLARWWVRSR